MTLQNGPQRSGKDVVFLHVVSDFLETSLVVTLLSIDVFVAHVEELFQTLAAQEILACVAFIHSKHSVATADVLNDEWER